MKRGRLRRLILLLAALLICLGIVVFARTGPSRQLQGITLWYAESDCAQELMDSLLARCRQETGLWVEARCFPDEQALGEAFESGRPDLLFCSHVRAAQLDERESLGRIAEPLPVPEGLAEVRPAAGASFFPLGGKLLLLLADTEGSGEGFESLEALLGAAEDGRFLACGCWADLLHAAISAEGKSMSGELREDGKDEDFAALYNCLAEAAFRGGLVTAENAADYVRLGILPCAAVWSTELAALPRDEAGLRVVPLPPPQGGEAVCTAELMGFALLGDGDAEAAARFAGWLRAGADRDAALAAGLVPITDADSGQGADSAFGQLLCSLAERGTLRFPEPDEPFFRKREDCERSVREALDLLA